MWGEGRDTWCNLSPGTSLMNVEALALFILVGGGAVVDWRRGSFLVGIFVWCLGGYMVLKPL